MKRLLALTTMAFAVTFISSGAMATPTNIGSSSEPSLQDILDSITVGSNAGNSSVDAYTDMLTDGDDANWAITGSGGGSSTMMFEFAGLSGENTMGIYDLNDPTNMVTLFTGDMEQSDHAYMSIEADGTVTVSYVCDNGNLVSGGAVGTFSGNNFGFFVSNEGATFYSDSTLNDGQEDHMVAYQGTGDTVQLPGHLAGTWISDEFILGFEDLTGPNGADFDYNDMVVMIQSVQPVPEPATLLLVASGLVTGVSLRRRRQG